MERTATGREEWKLPAVVAGIGAYLLLFYAAQMPSLAAAAGGPFRRVDLLAFVAFPDAVAAQWWEGDVGLLDRVALLIGAVAIHSAATAIGWLLIRWSGAGLGLTKAERFVFANAAGLSVISLYTLLVGLTRGLRCGAWIGLPLLLFAGFGAWRWYSDTRRGPGDSARENPRRDAGNVSSSPRAQLSTRWLWLGVPFALVIVLGGMLPPVDFDVREYHLQAPKEFFELGRITYLPHNVYANMALGSQMFALLGMIVTGDWWTGALVGKTTTALLAPLTALALFAAGRRFAGKTCGVVAALVYLSIPWIVRASAAGLVEGASAHYLFLAVYALLLFRDSQHTAHTGRALLAGFMAGSAVAVKFPAALFVLLPLTVWLAAVAFKAKPTRCTSCVVLFIGAALLACGPWFVKNWVLTGNPTYPLLASVFPDATGTRTPELIARWATAHRPDGFAPADLLRRVADVLWRSEWLSPLLIPLAALAVFRIRVWRLVAPVCCYLAFVFFTWWLFTHRIDRFWVPALSVVALLAGVGAGWSGSSAWRWVLVLLLIAGSAVNLLTVAIRTPGNDNRYFVALESLRDDPQRVDAWHLRLNRLYKERRAAGLPMTVLSVGDAEVFDLQMPVLYNTVFDPSWLEAIVQDRSPDEIIHELRRLQVTHIFVHWGEIARYRSPGNYGFSEFVEPEVFDKLVESGVLRPPLHETGHPGVVYTVRNAGRISAASGDGSIFRPENIAN